MTLNRQGQTEKNLQELFFQDYLLRICYTTKKSNNRNFLILDFKALPFI